METNQESSAVFCEHANETPEICKCPSTCYCKTHSCLGLQPYPEGAMNSMLSNPEIVNSGSVDEQALTLTWLKSRGWEVKDDGILLSRTGNDGKEWCIVRKDGTAILVG